MTANWKQFDFEAIRRAALQMYDQHNRTGIRIGGVMAQDSLDYWIAVAAWERALAKPMPELMEK